MSMSANMVQKMLTQITFFKVYYSCFFDWSCSVYEALAEDFPEA